MTAIGIDFGTTNSVVAAYTPTGPEILEIDSPPADWADLGFGRVLPTVFAVDGSNQTSFGWAAKTAPGEKLEAVKRLFRQEETVTLGGQQFVVEEIATMLFAHMKAKAAEAGLDAAQAVVTIPANSRGVARFRTKLCAGMAGLEVLALINEPTAAAMAYSARMPYDQRIMVVDWGGGTLDVTILAAQSGVFIEQASKGIQQLGGLDLDSRIAQHILESVPHSSDWTQSERAAFRLAVEQAKIRLSDREVTNVQLPRGEMYRLDRTQMERAVAPLVERVRQPIEQTLRDLSADPSDIDAIVLVGGTCKVPMVRTLITQIMGKAPATGVDPMTAVAEGAAIAAAILTGEASELDFFVGTEHALGTYAMSSPGTLAFSTIIPRNHKLPAKATHSYSPVVDESVQLTIEVVEGDPAHPPGHEDNMVLKEFEVDLDPSRLTSAEKAIDITYEYDVDGLLHVTVTDQLTGRTMRSETISFGAAQDKRSLVGISRRAQRAVAEGHVEAAATSEPITDPKALDLLQKARTKVIPFLDDAEAQALKDLVNQVESAPPAQRTGQVDALEAALRPYSYLF